MPGILDYNYTWNPLVSKYKPDGNLNNSGTPLRGHPDGRPTPLERPLDTLKLNINVLISTPDERSPLLKGHFSGAKGVDSQQGFHCICNLN